MSSSNLLNDQTCAWSWAASVPSGARVVISGSVSSESASTKQQRQDHFKTVLLSGKLQVVPGGSDPSSCNIPSSESIVFEISSSPSLSWSSSVCGILVAAVATRPSTRSHTLLHIPSFTPTTKSPRLFCRCRLNFAVFLLSVFFLWLTRGS